MVLVTYSIKVIPMMTKLQVGDLVRVTRIQVDYFNGWDTYAYNDMEAIVTYIERECTDEPWASVVFSDGHEQKYFINSLERVTHD